MAALIEIYGSVENALLIRENLDHLEIEELIKETIELRKDPEIKNREEVDRDWTEFKNNNSLEEKIIVNGKSTTIHELMSF